MGEEAEVDRMVAFWYRDKGIDSGMETPFPFNLHVDHFIFITSITLDILYSSCELAFNENKKGYF